MFQVVDVVEDESEMKVGLFQKVNGVVPLIECDEGIHARILNRKIIYVQGKILKYYNFAYNLVSSVNCTVSVFTLDTRPSPTSDKLFVNFLLLINPFV